MKVKQIDYLCFKCIETNNIGMNSKIVAHTYGATCGNCKTFNTCIDAGYIKQRDLELKQAEKHELTQKQAEPKRIKKEKIEDLL